MDGPVRNRKRSYKYIICPHCNRELSSKKFREHERLFYNPDDKEWCKEKTESSSSDESSEISSIEDCNQIDHTQPDFFMDENIILLNKN